MNESEKERYSMALRIIQSVEHEWPAVAREWDQDEVADMIVLEIPGSREEAEQDLRAISGVMPKRPSPGKSLLVELRELVGGVTMIDTLDAAVRKLRSE